jgi:hypothetical protein
MDAGLIFWKSSQDFLPQCIAKDIRTKIASEERARDRFDCHLQAGAVQKKKKEVHGNQKSSRTAKSRK